MGAARRTGPGRALAPLPAVAALACAALTGCGSTVAAKDAPAGMTGCAHAGDVDRLTIGRVNYFPQNHVHFSFPAQVTVTGVHRSQAVAQALCQLPAMPAGVFSCPMDWGINYRLIFTAADSKLAPVTVDATGCQQVTGLGPARFAGSSARPHSGASWPPQRASALPVRRRSRAHHPRNRSGQALQEACTAASTSLACHSPQDPFERSSKRLNRVPGEADKWYRPRPTAQPLGLPFQAVPGPDRARPGSSGRGDPGA